MKKIILVALLMGLVIAVNGCCDNDYNENGESNTDKSLNVGKTVTIDGKTYHIVNHNNWTEEYELSDGTHISDDFPISY